jgi:hypothetical protein
MSAATTSAGQIGAWFSASVGKAGRCAREILIDLDPEE